MDSRSASEKKTNMSSNSFTVLIEENRISKTLEKMKKKEKTTAPVYMPRKSQNIVWADVKDDLTEDSASSFFGNDNSSDSCSDTESGASYDTEEIENHTPQEVVCEEPTNQLKSKIKTQKKEAHQRHPNCKEESLDKLLAEFGIDLNNTSPSAAHRANSQQNTKTKSKKKTTIGRTVPAVTPVGNCGDLKLGSRVDAARNASKSKARKKDVVNPVELAASELAGLKTKTPKQSYKLNKKY